MEKNSRFKKFKELDSFIQNSLDKYFYVEPWKKLYERTGKLHRDIISDKSTIPDLIIYNKTFNKSDCFIESNEKTFVKFPRMRFILRPKYKKEYNPLSTFGDDNEVYFYIKKDLSENIKNKNNSSNKNLKDFYNLEKNETKTFLKQNYQEDYIDKDNIEQKDNVDEKKEELNIWKNIDKDDNEDEPEWANDNVENYNNTKIEFKAIPKFIEDKMNKELEMVKEEVNNINLDDNFQKNNIDIDNFFKNSNDNNLNNVIVSNNTDDNFSKEIKDFMNSPNNEKNELKYEELNNENNEDNNENDIINEDNLSIENKDNINEHFNIFDTDNKFNSIFIGAKEINNLDKKNNNTQQLNDNFNDNIMNRVNPLINNENLDDIKRIEENKIKNLIMLQQQQKEKTNQQYLQMLQMQKLNNQLIGNQNNPNYIINQQFQNYNLQNLPQTNNPNQFFNNQNLLLNNNLYNNLNYMDNINNQGNKTSFQNPNNINYFPFSSNIQGNNISNNNVLNANRFNNIGVSRLNLNNYKMSNVNNNNHNNNKEIYVNNVYNVNNMIYWKNNQNNYLNNLNSLNNNLEINKKTSENNNKFNHINNINQNYLNNQINNNIFPKNIWKNIHNNYIMNNNVNNINNNENNINNNNYIFNKYNYNNISEQKNSQKDLQNINPTDYLENPSLILNKNLDKKFWLVLNKSDGSIIHNFNSEELFKFLEEKNKDEKSLEEFTINDIDTDFVFPAKEVYENLKKNLYFH